MNFEPQKFFIGLMDFFSILLPGALLTYLLMDKAGPNVLGEEKYQGLTGPAGWAAFLVSSYLFGHLVFLVGSLLDELYDVIRRHTLNTQISRLALRDRLLPLPARILVWLVFKREANLALNCAKLIKQQSLDPLLADASVNTFQWSKTLLTLESPECLAAVQRFEADGKFFRSLVVVLIVPLTLWLFKARWDLVAIGTVLILAALLRYMGQRFKATNQAYWSVITLTAKAGKVVLEKPASNNAGPSHGGGVVYRIRGSEAEYLLVEASDDPQQWVLPNGHVEPNEQLRETAVRKVHQETGVWARIRADLGTVPYSINDRPANTVQFFLMESAARGIRPVIHPNHAWLPLKEATDKVQKRIHPETRKLLLAAERLVGTGGAPLAGHLDGQV
jgi:ADP-ribose pyrophosphatase YjhB (NUDIX family)